MKEPVVSSTVPRSPTPAGSGSPVGNGYFLNRPPPVIPDHELLQPIGHGAYGEVWLARSVVATLRAVKVVSRHDFGDDHPFEREFKGIQKFEPISRSHPGLVNILQIGRNDAEGYFYYVMELADDAREGKSDQCSVINNPHLGGDRQELNTEDRLLNTQYTPRTLRHDLRRRGRLPVSECVEIGLGLTSALEHLHKSGLVHRDVKPSNIIFVKGQPKLADIGLVTEEGDSQSIVGTEGYLAPEGPGSVQADLFSMGKVLYEISTGQDRRQFPDLPEEMKDWPDARELRGLNEVMLKACAKDLAQRYHSAEEMRADLQRLQAGKSIRGRAIKARAVQCLKRISPALVILLVLLAVVSWLVGRKGRGTPGVPREKVSVFVLPFRNEGPHDVEPDLLGRITDAFIDSLAEIEGVRRSPRKSGWAHQDPAALRRFLARTNDMRTVLTGAAGYAGENVNITVSLFERGADRAFWTNRFLGHSNELVAVEYQAVAAIARVLGVKITDEEGTRIGQLITNNLEALKWQREAASTYQRLSGTQVGFTEVQKLAERASELDPRYLRAKYQILGITRILTQDRAAVDVWPNVQPGLAGILQEDDTQSAALDQMAAYFLFYKNDWDTGYDFCRRDIESRSGTSREFIKAFWFRIFGWMEKARRAQEASENPEPTGIDQRFCMSGARWADGKFEEGAAVARRTLELVPGQADGYTCLAHCLVAGGQYEKGLEAADHALKLWDRQEVVALKACAYAGMGQVADACRVLEELKNSRRTRPDIQPYFVARIHAALGEKKEALDWLERAADERSEFLFFADFAGLRTDYIWRGLHEEPRFWALCDRLGLGKNQWPRPEPMNLP